MLSRARTLLIAVEEQLKNDEAWQMRPLNISDLDQHVDADWLEVAAKTWSAKEAASAGRSKPKPKKKSTAKAISKSKQASKKSTPP